MDLPFVGFNVSLGVPSISHVDTSAVLQDVRPSRVHDLEGHAL